MQSIRSVVIIYNPKSTGDGEKNARAFADKLHAAGITARVIPTKRRGHARILARELAERPTPTMIISSSGDGGYNEVINGVLRSNNPHAVTGVLPSGNANDHYHFVHRGDTVRRIARGDVERIDALKLTIGSRVRYAHSYIGLGVTPQIGEVLTAANLTFFKEAWLVFKNLFHVRAIKISVDGHTKRFDHLVFFNTGRMSKYLKVNDHGTMHDGEFEIVKVKAGSFIELIRHLLHAASKGVSSDIQASEYSFVCLRDTTVQLDGEVIPCHDGDHVTITSERRALSTIV